MAMPMKKLIIVIAIALQVTSASAADATLRLSCEGMVTVTDKVTVTDNTKMEADAKPEPVIAKWVSVTYLRVSVVNNIPISYRFRPNE